eukprot:TRINITY_DN2075_c0_g1_i16.p1 TRINITY_DN2075_c0_g1~~TRINITY_DN2075_c0_g1_i16.p1  ORF type:complete len:266 (+),score=27.32 TRINITY_DN2075_c0_g1_i16:150-947(+)
MIRRPPRSTLSSSSAASDVYKRQRHGRAHPSLVLPSRWNSRLPRPHPRSQISRELRLVPSDEAHSAGGGAQPAAHRALRRHVRRRGARPLGPAFRGGVRWHFLLAAPAVRSAGWPGRVLGHGVPLEQVPSPSLTLALILTRYYEMLDTVLLSLKRKPTPFIHVYHHSIMVWVSWSWLKFGWLEGSLWCVIANSLIHTFMYSHYLLAALKYKAWWKIYLTSAQLVQFATGTAYVAVYLYNDSIRGAGSGGGCGLWKGGTPRCSRWG